MTCQHPLVDHKAHKTNINQQNSGHKLEVYHKTYDQVFSPMNESRDC